MLGAWVVALGLGATVARPAAAARHRSDAAPDSVWVTVEREATLGSGGSAEEVRREALFGALADAVAQVGGVEVQSRTLSLRRDTGGDVEDRFVRALHVEGRGTAIAWSVLAERWDVRRIPGGAGVPTFHIRVRVLVQRTRERPDPAFQASLRLSTPVCVARGGTLADGDEVQASVMATEDAHWLLVSITDDSVDVLAPNIAEPRLASRGGEWRAVPADSLRAIGVRLRCALPPGRHAAHETLVAVATRHPPPPLTGASHGASADTPRLSLAAFNQWLAAIPPRERTLAEAALEVRSQR